MQSNWFLTFRSFILSIVLHLIIGCILIFGFEFSPKIPPPPKLTVNIVKAVSVDKKEVEQELKRLEDKDKAKQEAEIKRQKELENKAAEIEKKRIAEEKKLADITKKKEQEQKKRKEEELKLKQLEKEKKELESKRKLEEEKKKKAEEERKKLEAEKKKAEQKKLEDKKKAEEEKKRKEQEKALQDQLDAELAAEQEQQDLTEIQKYTALISRAVESRFNKLGLPEGLSCVILIRLLEGGKVADVTIAKSSGNSLFDKRAETAVYSASPLPVPDEARVFNKMRTIEFIFKPKN